MGARHVFWEPSNDAGLEHVWLDLLHDRLVADGLILRRVRQETPVRLWYRLRCDGSACVRGAQLRLWQEDGERRLDLQADGTGSGVYLYENLQNGFRADLPVDADGLVLDYPGQWRRRGPGEMAT